MSNVPHISKSLRSLAIAAALALVGGAGASAQTPSYLFATQLGAATNPRTSAIDASGNFYVAGRFTGTVDFDPGTGTATLVAAGTNANPFVASYDPSGNYRWAIRLGDGLTVDQVLAIAIDHANNVIVTGQYSGSTDFDPGPGTVTLGSSGEYVASYTSTGVYRWAFQPGYSRISGGRSAWAPAGVAIDAADNIVIGGGFTGSVDFDPGAGTGTLVSAKASSTSYSWDVVVAKYSSTGAYLWAIKAGSSGDDRAEGATVDAAGNIYVTGFFNGTVDFNPSKTTSSLTSSGSGDAFVASYSGTGAYRWAFRTGAATTQESGDDIVVDGTGDLIVTGRFNGTVDFDPGAGTTTLTATGTSANVFVARYTATGAFLWAFSPLVAFSTTVALEPGGDFYLSGGYASTNDFDPGPGVLSYSGRGAYVVRYSPTGSLVSGFSLNTGSAAMTAQVDGNGDIYAVGGFTGTVDFDPTDGVAELTATGSADTFLAKYGVTMLPRRGAPPTGGAFRERLELR